MVRKPQPKYGWHGQVAASGFMDEHGVTLGSRVRHRALPYEQGTVVRGPWTSPFTRRELWDVDWDKFGTAPHPVGSLRLANT